VQPEELNGGHCRDCGHLVELMRPKRKGWFDPLSFVGTMTMFMVYAVLSGPDRSLLLLLSAFLLGLWAVTIFILTRTPTGRLLRTTIALCRSCGAVRVAGRTDGPDVRQFHRGRAALRGGRRMLTAAYLFLLVTSLVAVFIDGEAPRATLLALMAVSGVTVGPSSFLRVYFVRPLDAWDYLFPR